MVDDVIIMAGGSGTRLWPASIRSRPKQFMDPGLGMSLLEATIRRAAALEPPGDILIVAHRDHVDPIVEECAGLPAEIRTQIVVLGEPVAKNTAPAIAVSMAFLGGGAPVTGSPGAPAGAGDSGTPGAGRTALVLAADHIITPIELFRDAVTAADELAREGYLVTFGVAPTRPETGYGYIEAGEEHGPGHLVHAFREKPDRETAERYYASGKHYWNSGMFVFEQGAFARELAGHAPEVADAFAGLVGGGGGRAGGREAASGAEGGARAGFAVRSDHGMRMAGDSEALEAAYAAAPKISIDYALMEQSACVAMVPAGFTWNDVGSWDEIAALSERGMLDPEAALTPMASGADTETSRPPTVEVDAGGNFVFSELPVALAGVEDLIVVVRNGRVLITKKGESQLVKRVVDALAESRRGDIL
ncbi:MAG: mannose-1-phosphate guanylyltransferase [Spirochaetes bacterium]|nr:mannose-1-phosphate guanylyltransferase [Spirochaetota bacterium]